MGKRASDSGTAATTSTSLAIDIPPTTPNREDFRRGYQEENPKVKTMRDIGKACGEKWKIMTYEEKVKYYDIATEKRAEFDRAMAEYIRRKESGEDAQSEDSDLDFDY
ncbi:high mobility group B protein 14 isoform X3 [Beta vulgaris subsp. vulgaris]|uniref:high mobility group B protein 14 isoform X3 n=1 Tax=Beta vulgaris subsp. vulgaris TaxID=3555 RepID=UPI00053FC00E|nr:high mobility group B protein 14 isoform X3 [Beta vulgaris subsp. vulgaris]